MSAGLSWEKVMNEFKICLWEQSGGDTALLFKSSV